MPSRNNRHRHLPQFVPRLLLVLGLIAGTLLASAGAASAEGYCVYVYPQDSWGTTICTP
jgi:hypothetical protein